MAKTRTPLRGVVCAVVAAGLGACPPCASADASAASGTGPAYKRLHSFGVEGKPDGFGPYGALVQGPDGNFYGTTFYGGRSPARCRCVIGGTVYRMAPNGLVSVLHTFFGDDGLAPSGGLAPGSDGAFYGLTDGGGDYGGGVAYRIDPLGGFTLLHSFDGPADDGREPYLATLVEGADGTFYGTTSAGGAGGHGTLFSMTPAGEVKVLHAFTGAPDGATPRGGLTLASDGRLYGTTLCGGEHEAPGTCAGTVFRWSVPEGYAVVHAFDAAAGGYAPQAALVELAGQLVGTTARGGDADAGTVYALPLAGGAPATLHSFAGGVDAVAPNAEGRAPAGRLVVGDDGRLYGTTSNGGANQAVHPEGDGTLFSIGLDGSYLTVHAFGAGTGDGAHPMSGLVKASDGALYGVTESSVDRYTGTSYKYTPPPAAAQAR